MAAILIDIADAVVLQLNIADLSQVFTAARKYLPPTELEDTADVVVQVVPRGWSITRVSRASYQNAYKVDIGVQKRVGLTNTALDAMLLLTEEIAQWFRGLILANDSGVRLGTVTDVLVDPIYASEHLDQLNQWTSVIRLTIVGFN